MSENDGRTIERVDIGETAAKIREHFERNAEFGAEPSPLLERPGGADLIGQVLYVLEGSGYAVVRNQDLHEASNLKSALKAFLD